MALSVPAPTISQTGASGSVFSASGAITITCTPVTFGDGTALDPQHATQSTYVLYRQPLVGALQAWDAASKTWQAAVPSPAGQTLFSQGGTWTGLLVPVGQEDSAHNPLFDPAVTADYSIGCEFAGTDAAGATETGASARSAPFTVQAPGARNQGGLSIDPQDPTKATEVQLFLKDSSLATRATVTLSAVSGGYAVRLAAGGASVQIVEDGTISLSGSVAIAGSLYVNGVPVT